MRTIAELLRLLCMLPILLLTLIGAGLLLIGTYLLES